VDAARGAAGRGGPTVHTRGLSGLEGLRCAGVAGRSGLTSYYGALTPAGVRDRAVIVTRRSVLAVTELDQVPVIVASTALVAWPRRVATWAATART